MRRGKHIPALAAPPSRAVSSLVSERLGRAVHAMLGVEDATSRRIGVQRLIEAASDIAVARVLASRRYERFAVEKVQRDFNTILSRWMSND